MNNRRQQKLAVRQMTPILKTKYNYYNRQCTLLKSCSHLFHSYAEEEIMSSEKQEL